VGGAGRWETLAGGAFGCEQSQWVDNSRDARVAFVSCRLLVGTGRSTREGVVRDGGRTGASGGVSIGADPVSFVANLEYGVVSGFPGARAGAAAGGALENDFGVMRRFGWLSRWLWSPAGAGCTFVARVFIHHVGSVVSPSGRASPTGSREGDTV
jgi:hypothetical protein